MTAPARTVEDIYRDLMGDCLSHPHVQEGRCVYCKQCGTRLYEGRMLSALERQKLIRPAERTCEHIGGCSKPARPYMTGWRCDFHRPGALTPPPAASAEPMFAQPGLEQNPPERSENLEVPAEPAFSQPPAPEAGNSELAAQLRHVIIDAAENAPRSLQADLGPSEAGVECPRRLAYRLMNWTKPEGNTPQQPGGDPWPSTVGTAVHAWLADTFGKDTSGRWLVENWLRIAPPLVPGGSCDLYDTHTETVIDWKIVGPTSMRNYKNNGPRRQYVVQAHLYGLGWELAGRHPKRVALAFLPRGGYLSGMWVWSEPYDRQIALDALARLGSIRDLTEAITAAGQIGYSAGWELIPAEPSHSCAWCPWYRPGSADLTSGCPGDLPPRAPSNTKQANGHTGKGNQQ